MIFEFILGVFCWILAYVASRRMLDILAAESFDYHEELYAEE